MKPIKFYIMLPWKMFWKLYMFDAPSNKNCWFARKWALYRAQESGHQRKTHVIVIWFVCFWNIVLLIAAQEMTKRLKKNATIISLSFFGEFGNSDITQKSLFSLTGLKGQVALAKQVVINFVSTAVIH